jgi:hypothetical protein
LIQKPDSNDKQIFLTNDRFNKISKYQNSNKQIILYAMHVNIKTMGCDGNPQMTNLTYDPKTKFKCENQMTTRFFLQMTGLTGGPNTKFK